MVPPVNWEVEKLPRHDMLKSHRPSVAVAFLASSSATNTFFVAQSSLFSCVIAVLPYFIVFREKQ